MKRYNNDETGIPYEDIQGAWANADIAQELYDTLKESRALVHGLVLEGYMGYVPLRSKIDDVLEKADKE